MSVVPLPDNRLHDPDIEWGVMLSCASERTYGNGLVWVAETRQEACEYAASVAHASHVTTAVFRREPGGPWHGATGLTPREWWAQQ